MMAGYQGVQLGYGGDGENDDIAEDVQLCLKI
jgi:hypothetical protein